MFIQAAALQHHIIWSRTRVRICASSAWRCPFLEDFMDLSALAWSCLLGDLARRGLTAVKLVISAEHEGLKAAITRDIGAT